MSMEPKFARRHRIVTSPVWPCICSPADASSKLIIPSGPNQELRIGIEVSPMVRSTNLGLRAPTPNKRLLQSLGSIFILNPAHMEVVQ